MKTLTSIDFLSPQKGRNIYSSLYTCIHLKDDTYINDTPKQRMLQFSISQWLIAKVYKFPNQKIGICLTMDRSIVPIR